MTPREEAEAEYLALLEAESYLRAEGSLGEFIRSAWHVLEPTTAYQHNWHIDCIAEHLEAVRLGQIRKLIINMPPRSMKSIAVTVCFPVWYWIHDPSKRFICASYSDRLSTKHNMDRRTLITSPWYQLAWASRFKLAGDQNQKTIFQNDHRGHMFSTSVGGSVTGEGADVIIVDDPTNPKMAASDAERDKANTFRDLTLSSRKNDKKTAAEILVMQRLHQKDLTGHVLAKQDEPEPWTHLCLEGQSTKTRTFVFPVSKKEKEFEAGEYLHPDREGEAEHKQARSDLGSMGYLSQYQQDPRTSDQGFFHREWWRFYGELPMQRTRRVMFMDCAEKPGITNDFTVAAVWDETQDGFYGVDVVSKRVAFPELEALTKNLFAQYKPDAIVIEDKSAGTQLIQNLRAKTTLPIIAFHPGQRSKEVRAAGAQPTVEAGNCHLPISRPWVEIFISRHEKFPNDDHDDEVDTTSMMVEFFRTSGTGPRIRSA